MAHTGTRRRPRRPHERVLAHDHVPGVHRLRPGARAFAPSFSPRRARAPTRARSPSDRAFSTPARRAQLMLFPKDRVIYLHESLSGLYSTGVYYVAKTLAESWSHALFGWFCAAITCAPRARTLARKPRGDPRRRLHRPLRRRRTLRCADASRWGQDVGGILVDVRISSVDARVSLLLSPP